MSANPHNGWCPEGQGTQLPPGGTLPLAASQQVGQGQYLTFDASGNMILNAGTTPHVVAAGVGYPEKLSATSPIAAAAYASVWTGYGGHNPASTESGDGFTAADQCVVAWGASDSALGKLSNLAGSNRPMLGLVFGVNSDDNPRAWVGPVAQAVARGVHMATNYPLGWYDISDAAASTAISERVIPTSKIHGLITDVKFTGAAIAADNTDFVTITIAKRVLSDAYAAATSVATYDSRAANNGAVTAFTPASFTLSVVAGALGKLETDIYTITTVKGGSGKTISGAILINGKAI